MKMFCFLSLFLVLCFSLVSAKLLSSPPVLIWGLETPPSQSIFKALKKDQFTAMMKRLQKDNMIVAYLASELTAKDINCDVCFPYLNQIKPMNFYSQVEEPFLALEKVAKATEAIVWHSPSTSVISNLELEMEMRCQKGKIHCFDLKDRNFMAHDQAMAVSTYQFTDCPVVHIYSAFTEESHAYLRRQASKENMPIINDPSAPQITQTIQKEIDSEISHTGNMTILRHANLVIAYSRIVAIRKDRRSTGINFNTTYINIMPGNESVALTMINGKDILQGIAVVLETSSGPLVLEFLPVYGNWYLTRAVYEGNESYHPRDLIFFSGQFSLCCESVVFFSAREGRIVLYSFHIDFIQEESSSGLNENYVAKDCWSCSHFITPALAQITFISGFILVMLTVGLSLLWGIGRNTFVQNVQEPPLHIKADA
ncbi:uncharacterized protein Dana_GF15670 [Drosophila ananassae]|uniref:Uncharacterized protein n=1 Tax=Drosophila ananassae TaxID=7217 RepID=B3MNT6_DROAN|nr:uncharacterized protein LOC123257430 [Drosophila ananassae]EDV32123.2 uncharacterized protein Dana_GF15670 [Drosophila ananassae]